MRHSELFALGVLAVLGGCAGPRSDLKEANAPTTAQIAQMSLPERAAIIKHDDPINRVELMLGEPIVQEKFSAHVEGRLVEGELRWYRLGPDLVMRAVFESEDSRMGFEYDWYKANPGSPGEHARELSRIEALGAEAVRNGYPPLLFVSKRLFQRDPEFGKKGYNVSRLGGTESDEDSDLRLLNYTAQRIIRDGKLPDGF